MDLGAIIQQIDTEIASRSSPDFGIKVGDELFKQLAAQGHIKKATFTVMGTGLFPMEWPAYKGKHAITPDWEMDDHGFVVGIPQSS